MQSGDCLIRYWLSTAYLMLDGPLSAVRLVHVSLSHFQQASSAYDHGCLHFSWSSSANISFLFLLNSFCSSLCIGVRSGTTNMFLGVRSASPLRCLAFFLEPSFYFLGMTIPLGTSVLSSLSTSFPLLPGCR